MIVAIAAVAVIGVMMLTLLSAAVDSSKWTDREVADFKVETAAETAVAVAASDLWTSFARQAQGEGGLVAFQTFLQSKGITNQAGQGEGNDYRAAAGLHQGPDGGFVVDGVTVDSLNIRREDAFGATRLFVDCATSSHGEKNGQQAASFRVQHVYEIAAAEWEGTEYALLANNVNCLLCHTSIDNVERFYNTDSVAYDSFRRVRLGSIETFHVRSDPDSQIAGAVYMGGDAVLEDGSRITDWHSLSLRAAKFTADGSLEQDAWGGLSYGALSPASALNPAPMENLYLDYLADGTDEQVDGMLPETFPSPFSDNGGVDLSTGLPTPEFGGNRKVDDNEFDITVAGMVGSISGGDISVIEPGWADRIKTGKKLNDIMAGNTTGLNGRTDGHVYLHGTKENPIILNGDIAIDGDLVISGYVKGKGGLRVSGNVYMPTDVKYLDGQNSHGHRTFGVAQDGTNNVLAIAAGGNVMMGDYYRAAWNQGKEANGYGSGSFNFILEEMSSFNRMEWIKTQPTLPGEKEKVKTGTQTWTETKFKQVKEFYWKTKNVYKWVLTGNQIKKTKYKWIKENNGKAAPYFKEWSVKVKDYDYWVDEKEKVQTGTKQVKKSRWVNTTETYEVEHSKDIFEWIAPQYPNPQFKGVGYMPRYYSFDPKSYVPIANKDGYFDPGSGLWIADEMVGKWDSKKLNYARPTNSNDPYLRNADGTWKAAVASVTPEDNWIDSTRMKILLNKLAHERDASEDVEIDATIYSSNSIFGIVPDSQAHRMNGRLLVNGLIVAADVGLLAPEGTQINYDARGRALMDIASDTKLTIRRHLRTPMQ